MGGLERGQDAAWIFESDDAPPDHDEAERDGLSRRVLDSLPDVVWVLDLHFHYVYVNQTVLRVRGFTAEEIKSKTLTDVLTPDSWRLADKVLKEELVREAMDPKADPLRSRTLELQFRHKDGHPIWAEVHFTFLRGERGDAVGIVGITRDTTNRMELERELRDSEARYRLLAENSIDIVSTHTPDGVYTYVSPSCAYLLGYHPDELVGRSMYDFFHPEDVARIQKAHSHVLKARENVTVMYRIRRRDGGYTWFETNGKTLRGPGTGVVTQIICTSRDVSDRKRAEDVLIDTNQRLQDALTRLAAQPVRVQQERLNTLGQMVSGIAHDLNNALTPVLGFSDLLLTNPDLLDDRKLTIELLGKLFMAAEDATQIVRRLREYYRRQDGDAGQKVDVNRVVEQTVSLAEPRWRNQAQLAGINIKVETDLGEVPPIQGSESEIRQALMNLVMNSIDAMPAGGVIRLRTRALNNGVAIAVDDTGVGMEEETRARCLEPFFSTKGSMGSGLGLAMVAGVLQRHRGTIQIDSALGEGTTVTLWLPAGKEGTRSSGPAMQLEEAAAPHLHVLAVDDDPVVRRYLQEALRAEGHTADLASSGGEAWEKFQKGVYDLVVMDRAMPDMSGDQLAERIKGISPQTPVLLLTGLGEIMLSDGEKPASVDVILPKPVRQADIREALALARPRRRIA